MIYLDTSALIKLLVAEDESDDLRRWLTDHDDENPVSCDLARVELMRAALRLDDPALLAEARSLLDGLDTLAITETVISLAETIGSRSLRSHDAIHLAAASQLDRELSTFVTYDHRLRAAATGVGMIVVAPGT